MNRITFLLLLFFNGIGSHVLPLVNGLLYHDNRDGLLAWMEDKPAYRATQNTWDWDPGRGDINQNDFTEPEGKNRGRNEHYWKFIYGYLIGPNVSRRSVNKWKKNIGFEKMWRLGGKKTVGSLLRRGHGVGFIEYVCSWFRVWLSSHRVELGHLFHSSVNHFLCDLKVIVSA